MTAVTYQIPCFSPAAVAKSPSSKSTISQLKGGIGAKAKPSRPGKENKGIRGRRERPCDACRKRKSKCVANEGQGNVCGACEFHGQVCTYVEDPQPRKKRPDNQGKNRETQRRRTAVAKPQVEEGESATVKREQETTMVFQGHALAKSPSATPWGSPHRFGIHIGHTTELEPTLFDIYQASAEDHHGTRYHRYDERNAFLRRESDDDTLPNQLWTALKSLEELVYPYGPLLIQKYRHTINPSLVVVDDEFFMWYDTQKVCLDPTLVAAIYFLTLSTEEGLQLASSSGLNLSEVEETAFRMFSTSLSKPSISTVQAGLLLMQTPHVDPRALNAQVVSIAYDLGLHVDCSAWRLSAEKHGFRKRLAWAVFMQDKWCSLICGRPSLISTDQWTVQDLVEDDYPVCVGEDRDQWDCDVKRREQALFGHMVSLTKILATVLDTFYTLEAMQEVANARKIGTQLILEKAKPIQINLKNWFTQLPPSLKMESNAPGISPTGYLHLAYFATEITLHRCIIRSLNTRGGEIYLTYVCRSAAKTRLISAMEFTNRLRPEHLGSFWYFPSAVNFALIGTFGNLLLATAPTQEEADFYRTRLTEYRWTLCASSRTAGFLHFAVRSLDSASDLLHHLPLKPRTALVAAKFTSRRVPLSAGRLSPPVDHFMDNAPSAPHPGPFPACSNSYEAVQAMGFVRPAPSGLISPSTSTSSPNASQHGTPGSFETLEYEDVPRPSEAKRLRLNTGHWG